jgi:hypothetical protein
MTNANQKINFFQSAQANRVGQIPGAYALLGYKNMGSQGQGASVAYQSRVAASQANGGGPAIAPIKAPFSFLQFATGTRSLILKRIGK